MAEAGTAEAGMEMKGMGDLAAAADESIFKSVHIQKACARKPATVISAHRRIREIPPWAQCLAGNAYASGVQHSRWRPVLQQPRFCGLGIFPTSPTCKRWSPAPCSAPGMAGLKNGSEQD